MNKLSNKVAPGRMSLEQAARQALVDLKRVVNFAGKGLINETTITALREALTEPQVDWKEEAMRLGGLNAKHVGELRKLKVEQAEQEPVAWMKCENFVDENNLWDERITFNTNGDGTPLYAAPVHTKDPCNPLQDLTDDEILEADNRSHGNTEWTKKKAFARAVIAKDREKNK